MKISIKDFIPVLILVAGILLRLLYLYQFSASPLFSQPLGPDVQEYDQWARRILTEGVWWNEAQIHAPLYPLFLSMLYRIYNMDLMLVRFTQEMLCLISFVPLYLQMRRRFRHHPGMAELFLGIAALYPPLIYYTGELTCEALLLPLLNLTLYFAWRGWEAECQSRGFIILGGICAGLAAITHPLSLAFAFALGVCVLWKYRTRERLLCGFSRLALFGAFIVFLIVLVSSHNSKLKGNRGIIQNNSGFNLFVGNSPKATGGCWVRPGPKWDQLHYEAEIEAGRYKGYKDEYFANQAIKFMQEQPGVFLFLLLKKAAYVWNWHEMPSGADPAPLRYYTSMQKLTNRSFGLVALFALLGFYLALERRRDRMRILIFLLPVVAYWGALTLTVVSSRYRLPLLTGMFVGAAFALVEIYHRRGALSLGARIFGVMGACLIFLVPPPRTDFELSEADSLLGEAYYRQGDMLRAREYLSRAVVAEPWSRTQCLLGAVEKTLGNRKRAAALFSQGAKVSPNDPMGRMNLGIMASEENRLALAEKHFQFALKLDDDNPETLYNYAVFKMKLNDLPFAEAMLRRALKANPSHRLSLNQLGVCLMRRGKFKAASEMFAMALSLEPENHGVALNLATSYLALGHCQKAQVIIGIVLQTQPDNPMALRLKKLTSKMNKANHKHGHAP
jgi:Flp pilus assembly protein TadD/4-amino-4-deoxy-L-arabinose transferase-like glycosyltransferase